MGVAPLLRLPLSLPGLSAQFYIYLGGFGLVAAMGVESSSRFRKGEGGRFGGGLVFDGFGLLQRQFDLY